MAYSTILNSDVKKKRFNPIEKQKSIKWLMQKNWTN